VNWLKENARSNRNHQHGAYVALITLFNVGLGAVAMTRPARYRFGQGIPWRDLVVLGFSTHKLSRTITTERVTEPLRAPFTDENDKPSGRGLRKALGELVTCPYCTGSWIALGLGAAYVFAPAPVRIASGLFTMVTLSDFLNRAYVLVREKGEQLRQENARGTSH
jgi:hypothetical protein